MNRDWTCFPDVDGNWYVDFGSRRLVGVITYHGPGTMPFRVYQTKSGWDSDRTYIGNCATVPDGVQMIKTMEELRRPGAY